MKVRPYGSTGFSASRLGYGVMRLPVDEEGQVDMGRAVAVLRHTFGAGINIFDTHHNYHRGQSEAALGEALADVRSQVFIQTKNSYYRPESGSDTFRARLETALQRLRTDYVDAYMAHSVGAEGWGEHGEAFLKAAARFREEGLARFVGFSGHGTPEFINGLVDTGAFDVLLLQYNLLDRQYEPCFARAHSRGMATGVMGPLAGGRLGPPAPEVGSLLPAGVGGTPELGLRFVLSNEDVDVAFSGMTLATWIDENAGIVERFRPLGVGDREHVDAAMAEKRKLADLYCTGCGYCMPCPHGVDIPRNFSLMNMHRLYGATEWAQRGYGHLRAAGESRCRASACTQCGECEPQCPQKIAIREQLREVAATLGDGQ